MVSVTKVWVNYSNIGYNSEVPTEPATVERPSPNVTINNAEKPGSPAYFDVSFMMGFHAAEEGVSESNIITIKLPIVGMKGGTPFLDVEHAAMRQLGPVLRAFADEVEQKVEKALPNEEDDQS